MKILNAVITDTNVDFDLSENNCLTLRIDVESSPNLHGSIFLNLEHFSDLAKLKHLMFLKKLHSLEELKGKKIRIVYYYDNPDWVELVGFGARKTFFITNTDPLPPKYSSEHIFSEKEILDL